MSVSQKVKYYLIHQETGQRYPIGESEVVIGRNSGDLLFPDDPKLSVQHCRIFMTPAGLGIHDLGSANGTTVQGKRLSPEKIYTFKPGNRLQVGAQQFKLQEAGYARKVRQRRRRQQPAVDRVSQTMVFVMGVATIAVASQLTTTLHSRREVKKPVAVESPYEMVDKEVRNVFSTYKRLGQDHDEGKLTDRALARQIRTGLLNELSKVQTKLGVVRGQTEYERRNLDLSRRMMIALIGQVTAMAEFAETQSPKANARLKKYSDELQSLNLQAQALKRLPSSAPPQ